MVDTADPDEAFSSCGRQPGRGDISNGALAYYDMFQFENKVKPDYSNAGGLEIFRNGEWEEWESDDGDNVRDVQRKGEST